MVNICTDAGYAKRLTTNLRMKVDFFRFIRVSLFQNKPWVEKGNANGCVNAGGILTGYVFVL